MRHGNSYNQYNYPSFSEAESPSNGANAYGNYMNGQPWNQHQWHLPTTVPTAQSTMTPAGQFPMDPAMQPNMVPNSESTMTPAVQSTMAPAIQPNMVPTSQSATTPAFQPTMSSQGQPTVVPSGQSTTMLPQGQSTTAAATPSPVWYNTSSSSSTSDFSESPPSGGVLSNGHSCQNGQVAAFTGNFGHNCGNHSLDLLRS